MREITKQELLDGYQHYMTVSDLKKFIDEHHIPDDARVLVQRVEDEYYNNCGWGVYLKEGEACRSCRQWNKDIKDEKYLNARPKLKEIKDELKPFTEQDIKEAMEQYHPAWSCAFYKDDEDILFIDLHY